MLAICRKAEPSHLLTPIAVWLLYGCAERQILPHTALSLGLSWDEGQTVCGSSVMSAAIKRKKSTQMSNIGFHWKAYQRLIKFECSAWTGRKVEDWEWDSKLIMKARCIPLPTEVEIRAEAKSWGWRDLIKKKMKGPGNRQQCLWSLLELGELITDPTEDKHKPTLNLRWLQKINNHYCRDDCHNPWQLTTIVIAFG